MNQPISTTHTATIQGKHYFLKQVTQNEKLSHNRFEVWSESQEKWFPLDMVTVRQNLDSIKSI